MVGGSGGKVNRFLSGMVAQVLRMGLMRQMGRGGLIGPMWRRRTVKGKEKVKSKKGKGAAALPLVRAATKDLANFPPRHMFGYRK
jgi:hypothetical protein